MYWPSGHRLRVDEAHQFQRDTAGTEADWLRWLPGAVGHHRLNFPGPGWAQVEIGTGQLTLQWQALPARRIGLVELPRMQVSYRFDRVSPREQAEFLRYFDLWMQRGGG
jgi:hypothetical protein